MAVSSSSPGSLTIPNPVECGYGDYIIYRSNEADQPENLMLEEYSHVFLEIIKPILYPPTHTQSAQERHTAFIQRIHSIDPTIRVTFIPRVLLDLVFVRQCIQEDVDRRKICPLTSSFDFERITSDKMTKELEARPRCWHQF